MRHAQHTPVAATIGEYYVDLSQSATQFTVISIQGKIHYETEVKTTVTVPMKLQEVTKKRHENRMLKALKCKNLVSSSAGLVYPGKKSAMTF